MKRILVVDDYVLIAEAVSRFLESKGCQTYVAHNARDALRIYKEQTPDAVVTDFQIGRDNGGILASDIRTYASTVGKNPTIILMSGDTPDGLKFMEVDAFVKKPFEKGALEGMYAKIAE